MPRYIDVDEFVKRVIQYPRQSTKTIGLALADTPTADVEKVVRCKDCIHRPYLVPAKYDISGKCLKYSYVTSHDDVCPYICDDSWYNRVPEDNFFCGFGERKETENVH